VGRQAEQKAGVGVPDRLVDHPAVEFERHHGQRHENEREVGQQQLVAAGEIPDEAIK